jgi:hypothetical protein
MKNYAGIGGKSVIITARDVYQNLFTVPANLDMGLNRVIKMISLPMI